MKILVISGAGFIGSHIVEYFAGHAEVRVLDNLRAGFQHNLAAFPHEWIEASIQYSHQLARPTAVTP